MSESKNLDPLFAEVKQLIEQSRRNVAVSVNAEITMLYWKIGNTINTRVLQNERAAYGKQVVASLAQKLHIEYGSGWSEKQSRQCLGFAESFQDEQIVYTLCRQLTWSHLRMIMFMDDELKRDFYIEMCKVEKWSVRTFRERINSMLYERTAISKKPKETIKNDLALLQKDQKLSPELVSMAERKTASIH